ncbi:PAS domain S-box protein [Candidatus Bathyarchaeota archaeon]|nr:PAS domain S-box protein [Candidatus Bathyarchaeota archaeon]
MEKGENIEIIRHYFSFEEKVAETETDDVLEKVKENFMEIFEHAGDGIVVIDKFGRLILANRKCEEITGYKRENFLGKSIISIIHERHRPKFVKLFLKVLSGERVRGELRIINKYGKTVPIEFSSVPIRENGEIIGTFSIIRDITARKRLENKLRKYSVMLKEMLRERIRELEEIKKRYSVLVEYAGDGVVVIRKDGKILFVNSKLIEMLGYEKNEILESHFSRFIAPEYVKITSERFHKRLKGEKVPSTYEIELLAKNGEKIPVELNATAVIYEGEIVDLVVLRDIRERKALQEQILKTQKLEAIKQFATMVAHDLRNPLAGIRNAAYYIKMKLKDKGEPTLKEALEIIDREVVFANDIVNDLLDFASEKPLELKESNINEIIEEELLLAQVPENVKIVKKLTLIPKIRVDANRIRRVFKNIIENAVQAMPKGGKLIIGTRRSGNFIEITFRDTGVGISEEDIKKLFTPFFTTKAKGMGIGLTICKKFVEEHGGKIDVQSKKGEGTVFTVKLPIKQVKGGEKSE